MRGWVKDGSGFYRWTVNGITHGEIVSMGPRCWLGNTLQGKGWVEFRTLKGAKLGVERDRLGQVKS
jgi:hypothetical protein